MFGHRRPKGKLTTFQGQRPRTISRGTSFERPALSKLKWGKNSHLSVKRQASIEPLSNPLDKVHAQPFGTSTVTVSTGQKIRGQEDVKKLIWLIY
jgi:hypothetical protein